jgi:hypothetical protein
MNLEGSRDRLRNEPRFGQRRQLDDGNAIAKTRLRGGGYLASYQNRPGLRA